MHCMFRLRTLLLTTLLLSSLYTAFAQTIFTAGNKPVTRDEFLKAYRKNNTETKPSDKAYRDYLELYVRFKLKVQAALDAKMDTLPNQIMELQGFRNQIADSYMNDEASMNLLIDEVFVRRQKDVHLAHIFIPLSDTSAEKEINEKQAKINKAYEQLSKGEDFGKVAIQHSADPTVTTNKGDIGFITVFLLPYDLETLAYTTAVGKFSKPFRSKAGFHIFKKVGERKSKGKIRIAQILIAVPPDASPNQIAAGRKQADSLYNVLLKGGDFRKLALEFSSDNFSYQNGGELPAFGVGRYEKTFENAAFSLTRDGEIGKPVQTSFGFHILKRLELQPVNINKTNSEQREMVKQEILQSDRAEVVKKMLVKKIYTRAGFKRFSFNNKDLWTFTDSILHEKYPKQVGTINLQTSLFSFTKQTIKVKDWQDYLEAIRNAPNIRGLKTPEQLFEQYTETSALEYYREHLEDFNREFAMQLKEFKEGNLLFEIMQRRIWDRASSDTAGLRAYYNANKNKYWWDASADAIIMSSNNDSIGNETSKKLAANHKQWRELMEFSGGAIQADSGRFELGQLPVVDRTNFTDGLLTVPVKNDADNTSTYVYVIRVRRQREPRSFEDARGFVINDYQNYLDEKWVVELKKNYPVKVNEPVVASLPK